MWWDRKYRNLFSFIFPLPIGRSDLSHCLCISTGTPDVCELERVHQHCHCLLILHSRRSAGVRFHFSGVIGKFLPTEYGANPRAISYCTKQEFCICLCYQHCSGFAHTCTAVAETPAPPAPPKALSTSTVQLVMVWKLLNHQHLVGEVWWTLGQDLELELYQAAPRTHYIPAPFSKLEAPHCACLTRGCSHSSRTS